ncbi:hypothetical protein ACOTVD_09515 [Campylobacter jejuni]|uniref:hypothetical protein n=1 Tax=Campylobacter jejuni TaxID=197 RepID=UPI00087363F8|nr:hypothetical protein AJY73_10030 [Campylobacter jejuni]
MFNEEYINSQPKNANGFVEKIILENNSENYSLKLIDSFMRDFKEKGIKLNKDFHNIMNSLNNYVIENNVEKDEITNIINQINQEVINGSFTAKPRQKEIEQNINNAEKKANNLNSEKKNNGYQPLLNDQGFVIVYKAQNENQEKISDLFDEYYIQNIKDNKLSKDLINSFNNSRNYFTRQEKSLEEINEYLDSFDRRIDKYKKMDTRDEINKLISDNKALFQENRELKAEIRELKAQLKNELRNGSAQDRSYRNNRYDRTRNFRNDSSNGISRSEIDAHVSKVRKEWIEAGKGENPLKRSKEDYNELISLKTKEWTSKEELVKATTELSLKADERAKIKLEESKAKENETAQKYIDPNNDAAFNQLKEEAEHENMKIYKNKQ